MTTLETIAPVHKSVSVKTDIDRAFRIFTDGIHSWWPKSHHIGKSPMTMAILEGRVGGRCYSEQEDGTECDWGSVIAWEPPHRLVIAWQIAGDWTFDPDLARSSEVEIRFTREAEGLTRVDLEHRLLERHGPAGSSMRTAVESADGWSRLLQLFAAETER